MPRQLEPMRKFLKFLQVELWGRDPCDNHKILLMSAKRAVSASSPMKTVVGCTQSRVEWYRVRGIPCYELHHSGVVLRFL